MTKQKLLEEPWMPDIGYKFSPLGPRNLKFQIKWLGEWNWLIFSPSTNGAFCKYCSLFCTVVGQQSSQGGKLVTYPFNNWKKAKEEFKKHAETNYHQQCKIKASNFLSVCAGTLEKIDLQIDKAKKERIEINRARLSPIIKSIIFLAKMGLSFRGHRDSGPLNLDEPFSKGEGNFRALLKFRAEGGDQVLKDHIANSNANSQYTSWQTQNEIISALNTVILNQHVNRINNAKYFSILCDETTDISGQMQMSFCVRFVENCIVQEIFLQFVPVTDCTGAGLASTIIEAINSIGLNPQGIVGQGYDGAAAMSGRMNGAQAVIRRKYPYAQYVHCCAHTFNLALSQGCSVAEVRNCLGTIETAYNFFNYPKRMLVLQKHIDKLDEKPKAEKLKRMCATRWVERHMSVESFIELLDPLVDALTEITEWLDIKTSSDANLLISAICDCRFLIALYVLKEVFDITLPLSKYLQTINLDLNMALDCANQTYQTINSFRENADTIFEKLFLVVCGLCEKHNIPMVKPRTIRKQINRANTPADSPKEYFRRAIFVPFLDETLTALNDKFIAQKETLKPFQYLLREHSDSDLLNNTIIKELDVLINFYRLTDQGESTIKGEIFIWNQVLKNSNPKPKSAIEALHICNKSMFTLIFDLLTIMATLPVTTCSCERSFSSLKFLKNYLRNSTSQNRLNGLALAYIHSDYSISVTEVLDEFSKKNRRFLL